MGTKVEQMLHYAVGNVYNRAWSVKTEHTQFFYSAFYLQCLAFINCQTVGYNTNARHDSTVNA